MLAGARLGVNLLPMDDGITCSETVREGQVRVREREKERRNVCPPNKICC